MYIVLKLYPITNNLLKLIIALFAGLIIYMLGKFAYVMYSILNNNI